MKDKCYVIILKGELFPRIVREMKYYEFRRLEAIDEPKVEWNNPLEYEKAVEAVHNYIRRRTGLYVVKDSKNHVWIEPHIHGSKPKGETNILALYSPVLQEEAIKFVENVTNAKITSNKYLFVKKRSGDNWIELHDKGYLDDKHEVVAIFPLNLQETAEKYVLRANLNDVETEKSLHVLYNPDRNESWIEVHDIGENIADTIAIFSEKLQRNAELFAQEVMGIKETENVI